MSFSTYLENEVMSASAGKLVVMLYDGAINFLKRLDNLDYHTNLETKTYNINKAYAILTELQVSLNFEYKEISDRLFSLYTYMQRRLMEANIENNPEHVKEVIIMLKDLRETWSEAVTSENKKNAVNRLQAQIETEPVKDGDETAESFSIAC
ncbi:MAG: flagellar export chaperone FliS [Candidatus Margulisbacteria bacterium]|nr:flagellar export chaperone FliS [Candidatus Margulisiibacteriota bacterium]